MSLKDIIVKRRWIVVLFLIGFCVLLSIFLARVQVILNLDTDVFITDKLKIMVNEKLSAPLKLKIDVPLDNDVVVETVLNLDINVPIDTDVKTVGGITIPVKALVPVKTKIPIKQIMHITGKLNVNVDQTITIPVNQNITATVDAHVPAGVKLKGLMFPLKIE